MIGLIAVAAGWGFDWSGTSLIGLQPLHWRVVAIVVGMAVIIGATLWREIDLFLQPRPNMIYDSVSALMFNNVGWVRLVFRNKVAHPSGDMSKSQDTRAKIEVYNTTGILLDAWNGRWSDSGWPTDYGDIDKKNKWTLNANDTVKLDIGGRAIGQVQFKGHYNRRPESPEPDRKLLEPDTYYYIRTELWAANMLPRESRFILQIPNVPQSNDPEQVKIKYSNQKPKFRKVGYLT